MCLHYQGILERFDPETQVAVANAYLELCQVAETQDLPPDQLEKLRDFIARYLLSLAQQGVTDQETLKAKATKYFLPAG